MMLRKANGPLRLLFWIMTFAFATAAGSGCQTRGGPGVDDPEPPPAITATLPLDQALAAGIKYGGSTLAQVKRLVTRRKEWTPAMKLVANAIQEGIIKYESPQLINALHLYQASPKQAAPEVFIKLVSSGRPLARQLGWQLAATMPSPAIGRAVERELSRALTEGEEQSVLVPEMAQAVQANGLIGSYTLLRQGLVRTGHEAFATAMADLDPSRASGDFMEYLALAPVEELRQLTLTSVNLYTCMVALKHLLAKPVPVSHPNADHLFLYAVSRNPALSELATQVIENVPAPQRGNLAYNLTRMPVWVQLAYIENVRRRQTPAVGLFLAELKRVSAQQEVVEEIDEVTR